MFDNRVEEAPGWCVTPLAVTAACSIALFFYPQPFFGLADLAVKGFLGG